MKEIIITGMGVLSPAGRTLSGFWETLLAGKAVYAPIAEFVKDPRYRVKIGARIDRQTLPHETYGEDVGLSAQFCIDAAKQAIRDAGLDLSEIDPGRIALVVGTTMGEIDAEESITKTCCSGGEPDAALLRQLPTGQITRAASRALGISGYRFTVPGACAASNYAVDLGKKLLDWGYADIVLAGGVDVFSHVAFAGFQRLLSLTPDLCRPFDKKRRGLVVGEGCGIVVMERAGERRDALPYGTVCATGLASDAYHMATPHPDGDGEIMAMNLALERAGLKPEQISYISAHGTGTSQNDATEATAISRVFGHSTPPVSSIKSVLGHSMGAAGILELIASLLMMKHGLLIPNRYLEEKDPRCPVNLLSGDPVPCRVQYVLSNSFAFGGQTSSVVIGGAE